MVRQSPETINLLARMEFAAPFDIQPMAVPKAPMDYEHGGWWKDDQTSFIMAPSDIAVMETAMARARQQAAAAGQQVKANSLITHAEGGEEYYDAQAGSENAVGGWP